MTESPIRPSIHEALSLVMASVKSVGKNERNTAQNYRFRGIDAVVNSVGPALRAHGVLVIPELLEATYRDVQTVRGNPAREVTVRVRYRFYGPAGDHLDATVPGESLDAGDKGTAKAMSVAWRIVLLQALCLPTDEPDPDSQSYERSAEPPRVHRPQRTAGPIEDVPLPSPAVDGLLAGVLEAQSVEKLKAAWTLVVEYVERGEITRDEGAQIEKHVKKRKSELEATP